MSSIGYWNAINMVLPSSAFPALTKVGPAGSEQLGLGFDAAADESCFLHGVAPQGMTGALTLVIMLVANSTAANADSFWEASIEAITPGGGTADDTININTTTSFAALNTGSVVAPTTAYQVHQLSITLTNADSVAPGDKYRIKLTRDANNAADDLAVDAIVTDVELRDAA